MGMRFDTLLFPGGLSRAFTLSYDDGVTQDHRLAALFRQYGLKCTFNLNSGLYGHRFSDQVIRMEERELDECYAGQELGGHGLYHSALDSIGKPLMAYEIVEDKRRLETHTERPILMFAYPFGTWNDDVVSQLRMAGYEGARTVVSTGSFALPADPLRWDPTCHHNDPKLMELAKQFAEGFARGPQLFYVWGHSYEFDDENNWDVIEKFAEKMSGHGDKIWYATNGEIYDYTEAYNRLVWSVELDRVYNPTFTELWFLYRDKTYQIMPGETIVF